MLKFNTVYASTCAVVQAQQDSEVVIECVVVMYPQIQHKKLLL